MASADVDDFCGLGKSWAAVESQQNSQRKPVNNCGGSHDFSETLVSNLEKWRPATERRSRPATNGFKLTSPEGLPSN